MSRNAWILLVLSTLPLSLGCGEPCGLSAYAAVGLEIVDAETGQPIVDATVTYTVDGEAQEPVMGGTQRGRYALGYELPGSYAVHVEAPGHAAADREYEVDDGECHVQSELDTIELMPI